MSSRTSILVIVGAVAFWIAFCAFIIFQPQEPVAHEANRLCHVHKGVSPNGIHADFVICRDGFVAER